MRLELTTLRRNVACSTDGAGQVTLLFVLLFKPSLEWILCAGQGVRSFSSVTCSPPLQPYKGGITEPSFPRKEPGSKEDVTCPRWASAPQGSRGHVSGLRKRRQGRAGRSPPAPLPEHPSQGASPYTVWFFAQTWTPAAVLS